MGDSPLDNPSTGWLGANAPPPAPDPALTAPLAETPAEPLDTFTAMTEMARITGMTVSVIRGEWCFTVTARRDEKDAIGYGVGGPEPRAPLALLAWSLSQQPDREPGQRVALLNLSARLGLTPYPRPSPGDRA
jgi:hypothetical protein